MAVMDLPPQIWLPTRPAIIRPAEPELLKPSDPRYSIEVAALRQGAKRARGGRRTKPVVAAFNIGFGSTSGGTNFSFTNRDIGTGDRWLIVATAPTLAATTTVTVGGVAATQIYLPVNSLVIPQWFAVFLPAAIISPNTIAVHLSSGAAAMMGVSWIVSPWWSGTVADAGESGATSNSPSMSLDIPAKGWVLAATRNVAGSSTTWANATERYDSGLSGIDISGADYQATGAETRTVTATSAQSRLSGVAIV